MTVDSELICSDRSRCAGRFFRMGTGSAAVEAGNGDDWSSWYSRVGTA